MRIIERPKRPTLIPPTFSSRRSWHRISRPNITARRFGCYRMICPLQWIAGLYAFHLEGDANFILSSRTDPSQPLLVRTFDPLIKTTSYAAFAEGDARGRSQSLRNGGHQVHRREEEASTRLSTASPSFRKPRKILQPGHLQGNGPLRRSPRTRMSTQPTAPGSRAACST